MKWQIIRQSPSGAPTFESNGKGELEGYKALWWHTLDAIEVGQENDGRGNMWPVGVLGTWKYTLVFDDRPGRFEIGAVNPTDLLVLKWWTAGKGRGKATASGVDVPIGERLAHIARTHMELGDAAAAIKAIAPNYMAVIQNTRD